MATQNPLVALLTAATGLPIAEILASDPRELFSQVIPDQGDILAKVVPCDDPACTVCPLLQALLSVRGGSEQESSEAAPGNEENVSAPVNTSEPVIGYVGTRKEYAGTSAVGHESRTVTYFFATEGEAMSFLVSNEGDPSANVRQISYEPGPIVEIKTPEPWLGPIR